MATGLLLLRVTLGLTLAAHGVQKLFGWFGGLGLKGTGEGLAALGFHPSCRHAFAAGAVETAGGLLLALGLLTPLAAALSLSVMIVAAVSVHMKNGFFITENGFEYNLVFGVSALVLAFTGPGSWSFDAVLGWTYDSETWGFGALAVAAIGAVSQLGQRRIPGAHDMFARTN